MTSINLNSQVKQMIALRHEGGFKRFVLDSLIIAQRNLIQQGRTPDTIVAIIIFPTIFLSIFWMLWNNVMATKGIDYIQYLVPIINLQAMFYIGLGAGLLVAKDIQSGIAQRFRVMPISRWAVLNGLILAFLVRAFFTTIVLLLNAHFFYGFRFEFAFLSIIGYFVLNLIFTAVCIAGHIVLAFKLRKPALIDAVSLLPYMLLLLISNGFSPTENFPAWLQPIVQNQPVSITCDALRALISGVNINTVIFLKSLTWLIIIFIIIGGWAGWLYRNAIFK